MISKKSIRLVKFFTSLLLLHTVGLIHAQGTLDIRVKKPNPITREFFYNGNPVSPLALSKMFPSMEDGHTIDTIELKLFPFQKDTKCDTFNKFGWLMDYQKQRAYSIYYRYSLSKNDVVVDSLEFESIPGYVSYVLLGNTAGGKFIVLSYDNCGGTLTLGYVFILDIKGDKLIRLGGFLESMNSKAYPVVIKGNSIINEAIKYEIPLSAR